MIEDYNKGVEFHNEIEYTLGSTDNKYIYSNVISSECNKSLITSKIGIRCSITGQNVLLTAGGGATGVHKHCYFIEDDSIYICVGDTLFCIDNGTFRLKWELRVDDASCFQVISIDDFILVHGELAISAISTDGNMIWSFSGRDIFVTPDGTPELELREGKIVVRDWNLDEYILDFSGNLSSF